MAAFGSKVFYRKTWFVVDTNCPRISDLIKRIIYICVDGIIEVRNSFR